MGYQELLQAIMKEEIEQQKDQPKQVSFDFGTLDLEGTLNKILMQLPDTEKRRLKMHYGIDYDKIYNFEEIAQSEYTSRVARIKRGVLRTLEYLQERKDIKKKLLPYI